MLDTEAFLRQEVESASPAKLRWMLIQKAHGLTEVIGKLWQDGKKFEATQWVILVQDIFTELLEGVVDPKHELAKQQSDLYVFLTKLLVTASQGHDVAAMKSISEILEIEKTTWAMFVRKEQQANAMPTMASSGDSSGGGSFDFHA